ncbi:FAD-dependent oxidoreductase [Magnetovibrio sp. PR-2]|uniref:FAD-dependent oxidoreductase n=1 Tax=Magnetovibrio sp. PR-2 TaxID=3120356 RepID=UPI002FCE60DC
MPSHYPLGARVLSMLAFSYVAFAFVNERFLHWFMNSDGTAPLWMSHWTEYAVILAFGIWRTWAERNPYTRKRLAFLTGAVAVFWWILPDYLRLSEPYVGALPGQPIFPQIHAPGTLTFFAVLLLVLLFGRRVVCGWNCPCVGIRETVGFAFREKTLRSDRAWHWRYTKWFFFALYMVSFVLIMFSGTAYVSPFYSGFLALVGITYFGSFFIAPLTGNRFYCRYLCPYGSTFGLLNHIGYYGIRMDKDACVNCRRCEQVCDMGIPVARQGREHGRVTGLEDCMGCGRCVVSCPTDALEFRDVRNEFLPKLRMDGSYLLKRAGPPDIAPRIEPPKRPALERCADWHEDRGTLSLETAMEQARRCLDCGEPGCRSACPLHNRIPEWLEALGQGDVEGAAAICHTTSNLPEICGNICPTHRLCEGGCTLNAKDGPVIIGALERFVNETAFRRGWTPAPPDIPKNGKRVAVIGAGPAGLACADELNKVGFEVTVYDKREEIGGLLTYGVPSFKLDKAMVHHRHTLLENAGVHFELGVGVDANMLRDLIDTNDALFLGTGAQQPRRINIPGQDLDGVVDGLTYLDVVNSSHLNSESAPSNFANKRVLVLGGGDTAMDCARSAVRQGAASVTVAYRRGPEQMRASPKEIHAAREEGVEFLYHRVPKAFIGTGILQGVYFNEQNGKREVEFLCDIAITAFGQEAEDNDWLTQLGIATDERGFISVDESGQTSHPKVFVGGDNSHGPNFVVTAVAAGRRSSQGIKDSLTAAHG